MGQLKLVQKQKPFEEFNLSMLHKSSTSPILLGEKITYLKNIKEELVYRIGCRELVRELDSGIPLAQRNFDANHFSYAQEICEYLFANILRSEDLANLYLTKGLINEGCLSYNRDLDE